MTIYILDDDPVLCAQYLDDRNLDKMIRDIAQVLCNAHHLLIEKRFGEYKKELCLKFRKDAHDFVPLKQSINCKWTEWVIKSESNYLFLVNLGSICCGEFFGRFNEYENLEHHKLNNKIDKFNDVIMWSNIPDIRRCNEFPPDLCEVKCKEGTEFPLTMPKKYQNSVAYNQSFTVCYYRNYYHVKLKKLLERCYDDNCLGCEKPRAILGNHIKWSNREKPKWLNLGE